MLLRGATVLSVLTFILSQYLIQSESTPLSSSLSLPTHVNSPNLDQIQNLTVTPTNNTLSNNTPGNDTDIPYKVYVWQANPTNHLPEDAWKSYPEAAIPEVANAPRSHAFHCSGGGTRAYTNCIGVFRAFHLLKLEKPKYLFGISGGSWFSFVYSFFPVQTEPDDLKMLSGIENESYQPRVEDLTLDWLSREPDEEKEMLSAPTNKLWWKVLEQFFMKMDPFKTTDWRWVWQNAIYMLFLQPFGVGKYDAFAYSIESSSKTNHINSKSDYHSESQPQSENFPPTILPNVTYRTVRPNRPFPIIGTTFVTIKKFGDFLPKPLSKREFTMNSVTPMYVGFDYARTVKYHDVSIFEQTEDVFLGGFVEPHGYGSQGPEVLDIEESDSHRPHGYGSQGPEVLDIEESKSDSHSRIRHASTNFKSKSSKSSSNSHSSPLKSGFVQITKGAPYPFTLQRALAHSSFAPGAWLHDESPVFGKAVMDYMNYWSPNTQTMTKPINTEFLISDGGCTDNLHLMGSIRRGIRRIILWDNPEVPLNSREAFDPRQREPRSDDIGPDIAAYFGYYWVQKGSVARHNQVFAKSDFVRVVIGLQDAQSRGYGAVATFNLTTINNTYFGIPPGLELTVTIYHAGRALEWEKLLPYQTREWVTPDAGNVTDPQNLVRSGEFANFPFFNTLTQLDLTARQVNLLSHLTTWVVVMNREHFDLGRMPILDGKGKIVGWKSESIKSESESNKFSISDSKSKSDMKFSNLNQNSNTDSDESESDLAKSNAVSNRLESRSESGRDAIYI